MGSPFVHRVRARYSECDRQGVVFNAHYLAYFDVVLTELWRAAFGGYDEMVSRGIDVVVADARVRYLRPARFDNELEIATTISHIGETSLSSRYEVRCAGELLAEGQTRHVFVELPTLSKVAAPDWARSALAPWVVEPGRGSPPPVVEPGQGSAQPVVERQ